VVGDGYRRRSARVLLVDRVGRLLLFEFCHDAARPQSGSCWITPGGGVNPGESLAAAAARELAEETGLVLAPELLGPVIAQTGGYADVGWAVGMFRDDFFFHRVDTHDVDTSRLEALESSHILRHRWWTLEELTGTTETVYPLGLVPLLDDLLAGRAPDQPIPLPWHH
jgi:8-oxo-dGTP pyrophosphatase MutT (NUDIX family)